MTTGENNGYIAAHVDLGILGKTTLAHRAVAMAFIPNPDNLPEINHKNGIKNDNRIENLEWCTESFNQLHASYVLDRRVGEDYYNNKLSEEQVLEIYNLCKENNMERKDIAEMYGVNNDLISIIVRDSPHRQWKHMNLEPLPPIPYGENKRGKKVHKYLYKITDIINNNNTKTFTTLKDAGDWVGCSPTNIRKYAEGRSKRSDLVYGRYKVEQTLLSG